MFNKYIDYFYIGSVPTFSIDTVGRENRVEYIFESKDG